MSAELLDGKLLAAKLKEGLKGELAIFKQQTGQMPRLVSILVGNDAASQSYALSQQRTAEAVGINYELEQLKADVSQRDVLELIGQLNQYPEVHGIIINKPVPSGMDFKVLTDAITADKDVEGMSLTNLGRLFLGKAKMVPCTPAAALAHLHSIGMDLAGKEAVVIGRSEIVGKPIAFLLLDERVTTTVCHSATSRANKLDEHLRRADIVIAAIGQPRFVKGDWIKAGAVVIDVGINQLEGKIVGDVDFDSVKSKAGYLTPVPGGVGPVTSVMLMKNAFAACKHQIKK
jgi:methylenetetrahydrofolate dehydrogenase (NADP+) / methenyltetrahydrofolate cyclohydrolase